MLNIGDTITCRDGKDLDETAIEHTITNGNGTITKDVIKVIPKGDLFNE